MTGGNLPEPLVGKIWCFIDLVLPDRLGLALCRHLRANPLASASQITMVLEEPSGEVQRRAIQAGADDYMIGPVTRARVLERMFGTATARPPGHDAYSICAGDFRINLLAHNARWRERNLVLTASSFALLSRFVEMPDHVLSREYLIAQMGRNDMVIDERTVDVWVGRLRRSLRRQGVPDPLRTVREVGYILDSAAIRPGDTPVTQL